MVKIQQNDLTIKTASPSLSREYARRVQSPNDEARTEVRNVSPDFVRDSIDGRTSGNDGS